ncbi:MAG: methionine adenosyltransferase [Nitrospirota bacterium]|nr:methionine adenosyltransferase [Nitrospirota bacterium]
MSNYLFTSESVTEGHPDKLADQISDAILDAYLASDKKARVALETLLTGKMAILAGEVSSDVYVDVVNVAREVIREVGYDRQGDSFRANKVSFLVDIGRQSPDIALGVDEYDGHEQGAGDQGLMFGYACDETDTLMPMPISFAQLLAKRLSFARKSGKLPFLRPDGKTQVTVLYENDEPVGIQAVVVSSQHTEEADLRTVTEGIIEEVVTPIIPKELKLPGMKLFINPTGRFVVGGPEGDSGLTGRKIIVDTYGGMGHHGGGCFSGKDPSKVDRSACYMARYVAKNLVAAGLAKRIEVQVAYAIGVARPVSVMVHAFGTAQVEKERLIRAVEELFDLRPKMIIEHLDLLRPIYRQTATYGHFGRTEPEFSWERTDQVEKLKEYFGMRA